MKTLDYFCCSLTDPFFEVFEILDNSGHPEYSNLNEDLFSLDKDELENYVTKHNVDRYIERAENKDLQRRAWFLVDSLHKGIAARRIEKLISGDSRPSPYNSDNLKELPIDSNNLISISHFNTPQYGISHNEFVYHLCPSTIQSNSSYWTTMALFNISRERNIDFKIRIDPFIEVPIKDYSSMGYKMWIYGKPLDWERIKGLRSDDFGQWLDEKANSDTGFTEYVWRPETNEVHFTCEEIPAIELLRYGGSRYFHAIFDKKTGNIIHCDGAIRIYNEDELTQRNQFHVKSPEVRKVGKRIKIFQVDDELPQDNFGQLVSSFFVWNNDLRQYFDQ